MGENIRYFLGGFIGAKVVDITQSDHLENDDPNGAFLELLFDTGGTIRFYVRDEGPSFSTEHPDDCACQCCKDEEGNT